MANRGIPDTTYCCHVYLANRGMPETLHTVVKFIWLIDCCQFYLGNRGMPETLVLASRGIPDKTVFCSQFYFTNRGMPDTTYNGVTKQSQQ